MQVKLGGRRNCRETSIGGRKEGRATQNQTGTQLFLRFKEGIYFVYFWREKF